MKPQDAIDHADLAIENGVGNARRDEMHDDEDDERHDERHSHRRDLRRHARLSRDIGGHVFLGA